MSPTPTRPTHSTRPHDREVLGPTHVVTLAVATQDPGRCLGALEVARAALPARVTCHVAVVADRHEGVTTAERLVPHEVPEHVWLSLTDSAVPVPPDWLAAQHDAASDGAVLVLGPGGDQVGVRLDACTCVGGYGDQSARAAGFAGVVALSAAGHDDLVDRLRRIGVHPVVLG